MQANVHCSSIYSSRNMEAPTGERIEMWHRQWDIAQPQKRTQQCHLQQHEWNQSVSESDREGEKYHDIPHMWILKKK